MNQSKQHFFICTGPKCFDEDQGDKVWKKVKEFLSKHDLDQGLVTRSRARCLRVCSEGPIGLVFPEQKWFCKLTEANIETFLKEYFLDGSTNTPFEFTQNTNI